MALIHWLGALLLGTLTAKTQSSLSLEHCASPWWGWGEHMAIYVLALKAATQQRYTSSLLTFHYPKKVTCFHSYSKVREEKSHVGKYKDQRNVHVSWEENWKYLMGNTNDDHTS